MPAPAARRITPAMAGPGDTRPIQNLLVLGADALRCVHGANMGDALEEASRLLLDDVYERRAGTRGSYLSITTAPGGFAVGSGETGRAGNALHLDALLTFMDPAGQTVEAILLAEVEDGALAALHLHPVSPMPPETELRLVGIDRPAAAARFAAIATASFARGTAITLHDGRQADIETLGVGDRVLTRDAGAQPIRWIGRTTVRAAGELAPILIRAGVLNNARDLLVSPSHRLFVYQRQDLLRLGRAEVLVQARHLVDGRGVVRVEGGFVDFVQLVFDHHQIVYAEGIAAESLLVDPRTRPDLPGELAGRDAMDAVLPPDYELDEPPEGAADALRRASSS